MNAIGDTGDALLTAFDMFWEVFWPLVIGFALSGPIQAVMSHRSMARLLGDDSPRSLTLAMSFGVASSYVDSCQEAMSSLVRGVSCRTEPTYKGRARRRRYTSPPRRHIEHDA